MNRKRIKKYQGGGSTAFTPGAGFTGTNVGQGVGAFGGLAGGLIESADMKDGRMSTGGALGSGALKGASMGAAFGPMGMLLGAGIGAAGGLMQKQQVNEAEDARQKAIRDEERLRANMENQMKHQQMNAVLDQYPIKGSNTPRFDDGGITGDPIPPPPNGRRWNLADLFRAAPGSQNLLFDEEVQQGYAQLSDEEIQKLIGTAVPMIKDIRGADSIGDKIDVARNADLSWVKPLREKAGLSKNDIINKAAEAGMLKSWAKMPIKAAAAFMDFEEGGPTGGPFNVNRMMVPTFPEGAGASAMPSFDFYADGAPVTAQQYAASLPQGQTINDHSQYWMQQLKPQFDNATGTWNNTGQGAIAKSAYGMLQQKELGGPTGMGGSTVPNYEVEGGEMMQYRYGDRPMTYGQGGMSKVSSREFEVKGPSHAQGGVKASDNKGARVYSDKLKVDAGLMNKLSKL